MLVAFLASPVMAQRYRQHQITIVDEFGDPVTNITQITVFNSGLSSSPTIYNDRAGTLTVTNPITTSSLNSTFDQSVGFVKWFQVAPDFKLTITDGTKVLTIDSMDEGDTRFPWYANYIGTAASLSVGDNDSFIVGTDSDMVLNWVNASDIMQWVPKVDGTDFNIGSTTVAKQVDFNVYVGGIGGGGLAISESAATFGWTGGVFNVNASSNFATNINTGTSSGAVSIGNSAAGVITIDGASTSTFNSDGAMGITTTDGSADLTIDSVAGSVNINAGEAAVDAVTIVSAGGMDVSLVDDFDFTLVSGAADENMSFVLSGASASSIIMSSTGTGADAFDIDTSAGGIDIDIAGAAGGEDFAVTTNTSIHLVTSEAAATDAFNLDVTGAASGVDIDVSNGSIHLAAAHATNGDITLSAGDLLTFTSLDTKIFDGAAAETWIIEGTPDDIETIIVFTDPTQVDKTITIPNATSGNVIVRSTTAHTTSGNMDASTLWGGIHTNTGATGAIELEMPTAVRGYEFTFYLTVACPVSLDAASGDIILALTDTAADKITSGAILGQFVTLHAVDNTNWIQLAICPTWSDGGA